MRYRILSIAMVYLLIAQPAAGADVGALATCTTRVFSEINLTRKWSGKAPAGCTATVAVEKRTDGIFVTAWAVEVTAGGWVQTALSSAAGYAELADKKTLARANSDIISRAARLGRCLDSIKAVNDPLECRTHATKSYLVDEVTGTEHNRLIWLDDNGRHTVVEYSFGDTEATPTPPADLFEGTPLQPGVIIHLYREVKALPPPTPDFT
ncbi:hypothetical protein [Geobacter anodireducens]|uniref:Lipoprotein n=1 Tax=Geobacter anodireducens TaxID=1340425 RepID=A0ABR9NS42_9BACT|nr:hypothetical protein [Geobacter anodireducens]MBE2887081.1 hypothetical protein [Geobacter anodireducens]